MKAVGIRWLKFNAVGAAGMLVQLLALSILIDVARLHYLAATLLATEAAIVHNFVWHVHWTWHDRPAGACPTLVRLIRFNTTNGLVSLGGNAALMRLLVGGLGAPYLAAALASIAACALANFLLAERYAFR